MRISFNQNGTSSPKEKGINGEIVSLRTFWGLCKLPIKERKKKSNLKI
jgi:hypothetical protein